MTNARMALSEFKVTNFRSVQDSGWIDAGDVTALIGTNESGKTNLLTPLWKLNPAKDGEIKLLTDAPRKDFNTYRQMDDKPVFITARFELTDEFASEVAQLTRTTPDKVKRVEVSRDFDGGYFIHFPDSPDAQQIPKAELEKIVSTAQTEIGGMQPVDEKDTALKNNITAALNAITKHLQVQPDFVGNAEVAPLNKDLAKVSADGGAAESLIAPRFKQVLKAFQAQTKKLGQPGPNENDEAFQFITDHLPVFVYYSTYGNLDSEIYLPHVIQDLKRTDISGRAEARARTLRVLFDFVRLKPEEILELGKDHNEEASRATPEQITVFAEKKKERSVLLQSASTELTKKFREWWKQGEYRFRFEADGSHFRIWVSDDKRPEEIELEGRSTGLQWFLSFYLIFLVESTAAHNGAVLLLDEPGHSLHPIAQRDLAMFFENLAKSNQLLYTTHSPFLIDADHLDRVRAVFVDDAGHTATSSDLREGPAAAKSKSVYPVHAALGLSVSDTLFQGCQPIVVEGASDQLYLSGIKNHLIGKSKLNPPRELLFVPTTGTKAIKTVASILSGTANDLPIVLCDGDAAGKELAKNLKAELYANTSNKVLLLSDFVKVANAEIEDLFPANFMSQIVDRYLKGPDDKPFTATTQAGAIIPQIKAYAVMHGIELKLGWKVDIARLVKSRMADALEKYPTEWSPMQFVWEALFAEFVPEANEDDAKTSKAARA